MPEFLQRIRSQPHLESLHREALACSKPGGLYIELGVAHGTSLRMLRSILGDKTIYGFDSFKGLPERWNDNPLGAFAASGRLRIPNVVIVEGWFAETMPRFADDHAGEFISYMHVDCDLYSSTHTALTCLNKLIVPGTVVVFDELFGYVGWEDHEYRALTEWGRAFEYIVRDDHWRAAIIIK